jgi:hypothetical protein
MDCSHPDPPEHCAWCGQAVVVSVDGTGACSDHIDVAFGDAATALSAILIAATEAFGEGTTSEVEP